MEIVINFTEHDILNNPSILDGIKELAKSLKAPAPEQLKASTPAPAATPIASTPAQPAPTAPPAVYTLEALSLAGASLMDAGKTNELVALLNGTFGVSTLQQLPPDKYNAFAVALRGLGAQI